MLPVVLAMLLILVVCGAVVAYVAFPHRGEELPGVPVLGEAMRRGVDALPTLEPDAHDPDRVPVPSVPAQRSDDSRATPARDEI